MNGKALDNRTLHISNQERKLKLKKEKCFGFNFWLSALKSWWLKQLISTQIWSIEVRGQLLKHKAV